MIKIKNASLHNLKGIDIEIPENKLVCVTGVSGSGKTTAMFDILYEESKKRHMDISGFSKDISEHAGFDSIDNITPVVAIKQQNVSDTNPRSTVGTKTGIMDLLKILFMVEGQYYCMYCDSKLGNETVCKCGREFPEKDMTYLSYNSPLGMCETCSGTGYVTNINFDSIFDKSPDISIIDFYTEIGNKMGVKRSFAPPVKYFCKHYGLDTEMEFLKLDREIQKDFLQGVNNSEIKYPGVEVMVNGWIRRGKKNESFAFVEICPECGGKRLSQDSLSLKIDGKSISDFCLMSVAEMKKELGFLEVKHISSEAKNIISSICGKLEAMKEVGLGYLSLFRNMPSLSGGESQRLAMMIQLSKKMSGITYVLDEPTRGLHCAEKESLISKIINMKDAGNSVIVIEHDKKTIENSDYIMDFGPRAGKNGGEIVFQGEFREFYDNWQKKDGTLTSEFLFDENIKEKNVNYEKAEGHLGIFNASLNNLKNIDLKIPTGIKVGIAGVSGSGKTSLISKTLYPFLKKKLEVMRKATKEDDGPDDEGMEIQEDRNVVVEINDCNLTKVVKSDQKPIGKTSKSIPATYLGLMEEIQKEFANTADAKKAGYKKNHFSFNSKGACNGCNGKGYKEEWLMGNYYSRETCNECDGKRFKQEILEVEVKGKDIYEILCMDFFEISEIFSTNKKILNICKKAIEIGVGYLPIGQVSTTLSGGESQRLKLVKAILEGKKGNSLYIFDEPTIGLSGYDVENFMKVINMLAERNSIIIIEHDVDILNKCDWIIELGPEAGENGGYIISQGTPADLINDKNSRIGKFL